MSATSCCRAWRTSPSCARRTPMRASNSIDDRGRQKSAGRGRRRYRRRARQGDHAVGRRADASQGHQIGAAARHRRRSRLLAGRGGLRRGREHAAPKRKTPARWSRSIMSRCRPSPTPETALDPATPVIHPELGDNLTFERALDRRRSRQGFRRSRRHRRRRPSCSAATPASPTSRAPSSPTGIRAKSG